MSSFQLSKAAWPWLIGLAIIVLYSSALFGLTGARTIISIVILFIAPVYFFLAKTSMEFEEKLFFSLFIGLGLFPLAAWTTNQVLPSFRLSAIVALVLAVVLGLFVPRIVARLRRKSQ